MAKHIDTFKAWTEDFRSDIDALKALVEHEAADPEARRLAAGALSYLVTRMDLIPDWNEGIGMMDDIMVVRVAASLASAHKLGGLAGDAEIRLGRLSNDADRIRDFLGVEIYDKFKSYCSKLADTAVRGRTPAAVISEDAARAALYAEVDDEIKKSVPVTVADPDDAEVRLKAYLTHKLQ